MKLTDKLLGYLNRVFSKDPESFLAIRLRYAGVMSWSISDGMLTTTVIGGIGSNLSIALPGMTISSLVTYLALQPGYSLAYSVGIQYSGLSAMSLIDGGNSQDAINGDHLTAYTSLLWSYIEANAIELTTARTAISEMLKQMSLQTASDTYLDDLGNYYGIPRLLGEADSVYANRIIVVILRPKGNNVAIEMAISYMTGGYQASVIDAPIAGVYPSYYGQFDVVSQFDLISGDIPATFIARIVSAVEQCRDAGTKLRSVQMTGALSDTSVIAVDDQMLMAASMPLITDAMIGSYDDAAINSSSLVFYHDANFLRDGTQSYAGMLAGKVVVWPLDLSVSLSLSDYVGSVSDTADGGVYRVVKHDSIWMRDGSFTYSGCFGPLFS